MKKLILLLILLLPVSSYGNNVVYFYPLTTDYTELSGSGYTLQIINNDTATFTTEDGFACWKQIYALAYDHDGLVTAMSLFPAWTQAVDVYIPTQAVTTDNPFNNPGLEWYRGSSGCGTSWVYWNSGCSANISTGTYTNSWHTWWQRWTGIGGQLQWGIDNTQYGSASQATNPISATSYIGWGDGCICNADTSYFKNVAISNAAESSFPNGFTPAPVGTATTTPTMTQTVTLTPTITPTPAPTAPPHWVYPQPFKVYSNNGGSSIVPAGVSLGMDYWITKTALNTDWGYPVLIHNDIYCFSGRGTSPPYELTPNPTYCPNFPQEIATVNASGNWVEAYYTIGQNSIGSFGVAPNGTPYYTIDANNAAAIGLKSMALDATYPIATETPELEHIKSVQACWNNSSGTPLYNRFWGKPVMMILFIITPTKLGQIRFLSMKVE